MITFEPPKVDYKRPNMETFVAFLQSKSWMLEKRMPAYYILRAPNIDGKKQEYIYRLPANENSRSYDELAHLAVENFADLYNIPLQDLFDLLSHSIDDLKKDMEQQPKIKDSSSRILNRMKKAMLANAS